MRRTEQRGKWEACPCLTVLAFTCTLFNKAWQAAVRCVSTLLSLKYLRVAPKFCDSPVKLSIVWDLLTVVSRGLWLLLSYDRYGFARRANRSQVCLGSSPGGGVEHCLTLGRIASLLPHHYFIHPQSLLSGQEPSSTVLSTVLTFLHL